MSGKGCAAADNVSRASKNTAAAARPDRRSGGFTLLSNPLRLDNGGAEP